MTLEQIQILLKESKKLGTIQEIYFEGGEPFLFYPLMLEGVRLAHEMGYKVGIVSNGYWSTNVEDGKLWLKPLSDLKIFDLSISDDDLHFGDSQDSPAKNAIIAAKELAMSQYSICLEKPKIEQSNEAGQGKGKPIIGGDVVLRGRAVEKFASQLPTRKSEEFKECPYEELVNPERVHIDSYGNVQVCQGISIGNCWDTPLSELIRNYDAQKHPICGPIVNGGPKQLVEAYGLKLKDEYVDECHLCYTARRSLIKNFPEYLAPGQVYGIEDDN
ncbi:MAG: hypothetical protein GY781_17835 [Gammaproteobacteria bacterium]|nr:hypothetical protein [Gammaproteobacteria bacterium]